LARYEAAANGRPNQRVTSYAAFSFRAVLVVIEVDPKRLLEPEALDVRLELRPAVETRLARELELDASFTFSPGRAALARALLRLLAQLLEIEPKGHCGSLP